MSKENSYTKPNAKRSTGFMAELEAWAEVSIYEPIEGAFKKGDYKEYLLAKSYGIQNLKRQVLASYHNGLKTGSQKINKQNDEVISSQRD